MTSPVLLHLESLSACVASSQFLLLEFKNGRQSKLEKTLSALVARWNCNDFFSKFRKLKRIADKRKSPAKL